MSVNRLTGVNSAAAILFKRTPCDADTYHELTTFWRDVDHEEPFLLVSISAPIRLTLQYLSISLA